MSVHLAWLVAMMTSLSSPERAAVLPQLPGWEETAEERAARYESIAEDLYAVVYAPDAKVLYRGPRGRARSAALLIALAFMESGFAPDVDKGPCYRGAPGGAHWGRCDGGQSACMVQIRIGDGTTAEGWKQADLFADRKKCLTVGLRMARRSFATCAKFGPDALLNVYASGSCERGQRPAKLRLELGEKLFKQWPAPLDEDATAP